MNEDYFCSECGSVKEYNYYYDWICPLCSKLPVKRKFNKVKEISKNHKLAQI